MHYIEQTPAPQSCTGTQGMHSYIPECIRPENASTLRTSDKKLIGERYYLNHAIVVKLYHPYTQFSRNVRLRHRRIATFSAYHYYRIFDCAL